MTLVEKLQIQLFGVPQLLWQGQPVTIPRSQHRALLYRLAATLTPVAREQLCFLFWPDTDDNTARRQLTQAVSHLRRALPDPDLLQVTKEYVSLDAAKVAVDSAAFTLLCSGREKALQQCKSAVELYKGPFLDGISLPGCPEFEHWQFGERRRFEQDYLDSLLLLLNGAPGANSNAALIEYARRYLIVDELAEEIHRRLIELYVLAGDRSAALRQFESCRLILARELGVAPLPETRAAYEAALNNRETRPTPPVPTQAWTTLASLALPFVGREQALARMEQRFGQACQQQGGVLLIVGEAGIGKSRLLQEFATKQQGQATILAGAGQPGEHGLPYHPIAQALRQGLHLTGATLAVEPIWLAEASLVLPELRTLYPALPPPLQSDPNQARTRLFNALVQLTLALVRHMGPLLFCQDDLHWSDNATLEWLAYLGTRLHGEPLLVIGTYRKEEPDTVAQLRHTLQRTGVLTEVDLLGLETAAVHQLLQYADPSTMNQQAIALHLQRMTRGNTFFLLEVMRSFLESARKLEELTQMEALPITPTVSEMVVIRLSRLSPVAQQLLEAGAVLGVGFAYELVQQTAGRTELEALDGLDELQRRYLLRETANGYQFHHEIIRRVVYERLSYWRKRLLHRRAAEALEMLYATDLEPVSWQLATHYEQANLPAQAIPFYEQAARFALRTFAHQEAITLLTNGVKLLQSLPTTPERQRQELEIQIMLGSTLIGARGFGAVEMKEAYARAWELAQQLPNQPGLFSAMWGVWSFYNTQGQMRQALDVVWPLLALAEREQNVDHIIGACRALGSNLFHAGELQLARQYQERAIALYDRQQHQWSHIFHYGADSAVICQATLAITLWLLGYPDQALACSEKTLALAEAVAHPFSQTFALIYIAWFHQLRRARLDAQRCAVAGLALSSQHNFKGFSGMGAIIHGWALVDQGQVRAGIQQIEHGVSIWKSTGGYIAVPLWQSLLAEAYGKDGRTAQGLALLTEALADL